MSDIPSRFGNDPQPVGPLGIIAMDGCKSLGEKVNSYLVKWEKEPENADQVLLTYPGLSAQQLPAGRRLPPLLFRRRQGRHPSERTRL